MKAVVGAPGDRYEQEADSVADRVEAGRPVPAVSRLMAGGLSAQRMADDEAVQRTEDEEPVQLTSVQRMCSGCSDEGEAVQRKEDEDPIQLKAEDEEPVQLKAKDEEPVQLMAAEEEVQRMEDEEPVQMEAGAASVSPSVTSAASAAVGNPGPGGPMAPGTRGTLESSLHTDLGDVRVHDDARAHGYASDMQARAFTHGNHIWLGRGESQSDVGLMAHETTHVLQQEGVVRRKPKEPGPGGGGGAGQGASGGAGGGGPAGGTAAPGGEGAGTAKAPGGGAKGESGGKGAAGEGDAKGKAGATAEAAPAPVGGDGAAAGGPELLMPEPPNDLSADERARLEEASARAGENAESAAALPAAEEQVGEARGAVQEPEAETAGRAESALVEALGQRPEPSPEIEALCERIKTVIKNKRPPDEDSLVDADPEQMAGEAGGELNESVEGDAERVQGEYDDLNESPQGTPEQVSEPMAETPAAEPGPDINATAAQPDGVSADEVSLDADVAASSQQIEDAGMTTEPAELVESGPIAEAREAQGGLAAAAQEDPAEVMARQTEVLAGANADMAALQAAALASLTASRTETTGGTRGQQEGMVSSEGQTREQISATARGLFTGAQSRVNALLDPLPRTAMARWEAGVGVLSTRFKNSLAEVKRWIDERHSGVGGAVVEVWDAVTGLPGWVTDSYDRAETEFGNGVCDLIREISTEVNGVVAACEAIIDDAQTQISELFANLPAELQEWAAGQQAEFDAQLNGLTQQAHETRDNFNRDLTRAAAQSVQEVRQEVHALREAAKGLIGKIADAIERFAEDPAKFIIDGLLEIVGISPGAFWALVNRIGEAIDSIAEDPVSFASNVAAALAQGFQQFFDNFAQHLMGGFFDWLFSGLGSVGIQIPSDTSPTSLITFFLQLMGITWANIRPILVKHVGEENIALLEQAWELISALIEMGPEGLFEMIKEQLDPANLIQMVIDAALGFMVEALIKAVTPRILLLFNPAGAILQAIEAIFRILSWVFNNAARIFALVETVVGGVTDLIAGNIGGMATAVEGALRGMLVPVIDFLAGYLGMGDLPDRIAGVIGGMQQWVLAGIDRAVGFIVARARGLLSALGLGGEEDDSAATEEGEGDGKETPEERERLDRAVAAAEPLVDAPGATVESVESQMAAIKSEFQLTSLELVPDEEGIQHVEAVINPKRKGGKEVIFTEGELAELEATAQGYARQIRKEGDRDVYLADPEGYLRGQLTTGEMVEAAGVEDVAEHAGGLRVLRNVYLQLVDANGNHIAGQQQELDFLVLGEARVQEIVSAKLKPKRFSATSDRSKLAHYQRMPLAYPELGLYAYRRFGHAKEYKVADQALVYYNGGQSASLGAFRGSYLSGVVVDEVVVTGLFPGPYVPGAITLTATEPQLVSKTIELIQKHL